MSQPRSLQPLSWIDIARSIDENLGSNAKLCILKHLYGRLSIDHKKSFEEAVGITFNHETNQLEMLSQILKASDV